MKDHRDQLINVDRRNRLLYFKHTKTASLEIEQPLAGDLYATLDRANGFFTFHLPPRPDESGEPVVVPPPLPTDIVVKGKDGPEITKALGLLERKSNQEFVDRGLWTLYLGLGTLDWVEAEGTATVSSPILLVPVSLTRASLREPFRLVRTDDDTVVNPALLVKLETDFGIQLAADDLADHDLNGVLAAFRLAIRGYEGWRVTRRAVLTTFSFQKEAMHRDLLDNADQIINHPLIEVLALGTDAPRAGAFGFDPVPEDDLDRVAPPEDLVNVRDADATQRRCILAARDGRSFVMDGPPGSGKSQTITNMIAELLHTDKTVLFVSEKAAALDVVHNRLKAAKLDDFVLQLHSHKATRKAVAAELGTALTKRPNAPVTFTPSAKADLVKRRKALSTYALALNEVRQPLGRSLHQVLGEITALHALPQAPVPSTFGLDLTPETLTHIRDTAEQLGRAWAPVERGDAFLWRDLQNTSLSASRRHEVEADLDRAAGALDALRTHIDLLQDQLGLGWYERPADVDRLLPLLALLDDRQPIPARWLTSATLNDVQARVGTLHQATAVYDLALVELREIVGDAAEFVEPALLGPFADAEAALHTASAPVRAALAWRPEDTATAELVATQRAFLVESTTTLDQIEADAAKIASSFGLATADITPQRAVELAELGALVTAPARPEPGWFDRTAQTALDEALGVLSGLVSDFRARHQALRSVFTDDALNLDLFALQRRFAEVHRGFGKLRRAYRDDKKALAACTVTGRVDRQVLERLPEGVAWQERANQLSAAESRHADLLGDHYYSRAEADFAKIHQAISVARRAIHLARDERIGDSFTDQLARGGAPDPAIHFLAENVRAGVDSWLRSAGQVLGIDPERLHTVPLARLRAWAADAVAPLQVVVDTMTRLSTLTGRALTIESTRSALTRAGIVNEKRELVAATMPADQELLGSHYRGVETDWVAVAGALDWAENVRRALGGPVRMPIAEALLTCTATSAELEAWHAAWAKTSKRVIGQFDGQRAEEVRAELRDSDFDVAEALLEELRDSVGDIETWASYASAKSELEHLGLEPVVTFCREQRVPQSDVRAIVERAVLEAWADAVFETDRNRLGPLRSVERDALVDEFRKLDTQQVALAAARVINACAQRRPSSMAGQAGVIKRQAEISRKHKPIRTLLTEAGETAQRLKPCFMMSPLSVSQFLPPTLRFDVVIFDEASQVLPADAINCVYRGDQLIVAGDKMQLPPTRFFGGGQSDDDTYDDEDEVHEFESVLDLCKGAGALESLPLSWHYRSQHEDLITYSNYRFYGGKLATFPGATHKADDIGIELIKVDGVYRRGGARDNPIEARTVVERVLYHRRHHPDLTIGVVTFSGAQQDAIEREVEHQAQRYPELAGLRTDDRLDGFFVKNLENVQGDERDIIIFSVGYGKDESGKFSMQVAHLNRQGSERRLNVAITRAKRRVEIVTSVRAEDFPGTAKAGAMKHLPRYLDFADRGIAALALADDESSGDVESPFEAEVVRTLHGWGFDAVPQVGVAGYRVDIGIRHPEKPGRFVLGVECDGAMYHSSKVARDRDRLRQQVLEGLGWTIHRIWGPSWYRNRAEQEARLRQAIDAAISGRPSAVRDVAPVDDVLVDQHIVDLEAPPAWTEPYRLARLSSSLIPYDEMHSPAARPHLRKLIEETVRAEGPIHQDRALTTIRKAWGGDRSGPRIKAAFESAVRDLRARIDRDGDGFLRPRSAPVTAVRVPTDDPDTKRDVKYVPMDELKLAVVNLVRDCHAIDRDELTERVARLFGWGRRGPAVSAALYQAIEELDDAGAVTVDGELVLGEGSGPGH
ncbi:DUF3320 domain-containing protein [Actinokineospora fastidiosa]|uniref:AAA domain-containing protein n=1 Tax=Actinokineospora fastidiosa TaxID=1816 RepID=A0A918LHF6_9PSEU|nr:DUF3320 domain-containing protein [Actinokineospora fastidiosa]GGS47034.1 hypothetical protein GCM10010171_47810 [Actinokineospora fastidiosa]